MYVRQFVWSEDHLRITDTRGRTLLLPHDEYRVCREGRGRLYFVRSNDGRYFYPESLGVEIELGATSQKGFKERISPTLVAETKKSYGKKSNSLNMAVFNRAAALSKMVTRRVRGGESVDAAVQAVKEGYSVLSLTDYVDWTLVGELTRKALE